MALSATSRWNSPRSRKAVLEGGKKDQAAGIRRFGSDHGFKFNTPNAASFLGEYLLLSRYDADSQRGVVELVDMPSNCVVHTWLPDFEAIPPRFSLDSILVDSARDCSPLRNASCTR